MANGLVPSDGKGGAGDRRQSNDKSGGGMSRSLLNLRTECDGSRVGVRIASTKTNGPHDRGQGAANDERRERGQPRQAENEASPALAVFVEPDGRLCTPGGCRSERRILLGCIRFGSLASF